MAKFTREHIDFIRELLANKLKSSTSRVSRSELFQEFKDSFGYVLEQYRFERELSQLIKDGTLSGFAVKTGRNGGIVRNALKKVKLECNSVVISGKVEDSKLRAFISSIKQSQ
jgi:hypothetical protein